MPSLGANLRFFMVHPSVFGGSFRPVTFSQEIKLFSVFKEEYDITITYKKIWHNLHLVHSALGI